MPSAAEIEQLQQMMEQMVNDPAFQEQMRQMQEMLGEQGMGDMAPFLTPDFMQGISQYNNCLADGLGDNWIVTMSERLAPYMEQVESLCRAGRFDQAKNFLEDEDNVKRYFSSQEIAVMEGCEAQFPDQSMLEPDPALSGQKICQDFNQ